MGTEQKKIVLSPLKEGIIPVDEWEPTEEQIIVRSAGHSLIIPFDRMIDRVENDRLNVFYISHKSSYVDKKNFDILIRYINYFINFYDDEHELIMNYFHCKWMIDNKKTKPGRKLMIKWIYDRFVTPSIYRKIWKMVEDNYRIDLAQKKEPGKEYSESMEFTNKHAKLLHLISMFIKLLIPLVMHYITIIAGKKEVANLIYYYRPLFDLVYEVEHVNLYAKMMNTINIKVAFNETTNMNIWQRYAMTNVDGVSYAEELLDKNLIVDNIFKYVFKENLVAFNSVIIRTQLHFRCVKNFGINMHEISTEKDEDGLSYLDKLEMNMNKIDENSILLSAVNIKDTIKRIEKQTRIHITKEEVDYYIDNTKVSKIAKCLVFYYYSKIFGGFVDLNQIKIKQYMKLMILMKRRLEYNGFVFLSQIISANVDGRITNRVLHNRKYIDKVRSSATFKNLLDNKYEIVKDLGKEEVILNMLMNIVNTKFTIVDYDMPENMGENIYVKYDVISQEFLDFVNSI